MGTFNNVDQLFPIEHVDPYDNVTRYIYQGGRLLRVEYPSGIHECYNFNPAWIGSAPNQWSGTYYSGIEITYVDATSASDLSTKKTCILFYRLRDSSGQLVPNARPFAGDRLYRVYNHKSIRLNDLGSNATYNIPTGTMPERYEVHELYYGLDETALPATSLVHHINQRLADDVLPTSSMTAPVTLVQYDYVVAAGVYRVQTETLPIYGLQHVYTYTTDPQSAHRLDRVVRFDGTPGNIGTLGQTTRDFDDLGRVTQVVVLPPAGAVGRPRASDPDNGGWSEPASLTYKYEYAGCASCERPSVVEELPSGRRTEWDYDAVSGLPTRVRSPDPRGGATLVETQYNWQPAVSAQPFGAYKLVSMTTPDGKQWSYAYTSVARPTPLDRESFGVKHQMVVVTSPVVTTANGLTAPLVSETGFNVAAPAIHAQGYQLGMVGQELWETDGDGIRTDFQYAGNGLLTTVVVNQGGAGGPEEIVTAIESNRWGTITKVTENASAAPPQVTTFGVDGAGTMQSVSSTVGAQIIETRLYRDRWGNICARLRSNQKSDGSAPNDFGPNPRSDVARAWLRDEWHHDGYRLLTSLEDRRTLDRDDDIADPISDAPDARYLREVFFYDPRGLLTTISHGNGSVTTLTYDGYGTLYKAVRTAAGQAPLLIGKWFVNNAMEVVREYRGGTDVVLATNLTRNAAGYVTAINEPSWSPAGYAWPVASASRGYVYDVMGQLTSETITEILSSGPSALCRRTQHHFDEVGRQWKDEVFEGNATVPSQAYVTTWQGASRQIRSEGPGGRFITRSYDSLSRVKQIENCVSGNPDRTTFDYVSRSNFLWRVTKQNWDAAASTPGYVSRSIEYARDTVGRVSQVKIGPSGNPLVHSFTYFSSGLTESYTDPSGKIERYLPDALGRLAERFLPGTQPIWNESAFVDYTGPNCRTEVLRTDGGTPGRVTRTIFDFAGRAEVVMEPGSSTEPTAGSPHQPFSRFLSYDSASRLANVYAGDDVRVRFERDGVGRTLLRSRIATASNPLVSWAYGRDEVRWNGLGQMTETISRTGFGPGGVGDIYAQELFEHDALGRLHEERFQYSGVPNATEVESTFTAGDPFRSGVTYRNNLTGGTDDLWLQYTPDAVGRLQGINWKTSAAGAWTTLASYEHEGAAIRKRTTSWELGHATPPSPISFDTAYSYDAYGRMERITQSFSAQAQVDFVYDLASNLVKEVYAKQGGANRVGDRFAYDEHHRLKKAWLGSDQAHMNATDPDGGVGAFVQKQTYGLDAANNRTTVATQIGQGGATQTSTYALQGGTPQGPSNRYDTVDGVQSLYDARGNTVFDGRYYYIYDALSRLTEVYKLSSTGAGAAQSSSPSSSATQQAETFTVSDPSALRQARTNIVARVSSTPAEVIFRSNDPLFIAQLKDPVSAAAVESTSTSASASTEEDYELLLVAVYLYDVMNRRVVRVVSGVDTYYYAWDGWQEAQEMVLGVDPVNQTVLASRPRGQCAWGEQLDELVAYRTKQVGSWANYYVAEGGAHCPSRVLDSLGNVVEVQEYDPYGKTTFWVNGTSAEVSSRGNAFGWKGHRIDPETGLVYIRNRYYTPLWGRFLSQDPLGTWADGLQYGNDYIYGRANPLVWGDPDGLQVRGDLGVMMPGAGATTVLPADNESAMGAINKAWEANNKQAGLTAPESAFTAESMGFLKGYDGKNWRSLDPKQVGEILDKFKRWRRISGGTLVALGGAVAGGLAPAGPVAPRGPTTGVPSRPVGPITGLRPCPQAGDADFVGPLLPPLREGRTVRFAGRQGIYPAKAGEKSVVTVKYTGTRAGDYKAANEAAGLSNTPSGYTWHHVADYDAATNTGTMELVETSAHQSIGHTGGVAQYQQATGGGYGR